VRVEGRVAGGGREVVLGQVQRPGGTLARGRVDDDERLVPLEHLVGEVHAADADVDDVHRLRQRCAVGEQAPRHLGAEGVVGEEDVAHPGDEDPHDGTASSSGRK
jgi:hypothetical protein